MEFWRHLEGYEHRYEVSNMGRVRSLERIVVKFGKYHVLLKETILKPQDHYQGYQFIYLYKRGVREKMYVHRAVALTFVTNEDVETFIIVNHKDLDKTNNHYLNLEWVTHKENARHYLQSLKNNEPF